MKRHMCPAFLNPPTRRLLLDFLSQKGSRHVTLSECLMRLMQLKSFSANEMALAMHSEQEIKRKGGAEKDGSRCLSLPRRRREDAASKQYEGPTKPRLITSISPATSTWYTRTPAEIPREPGPSEATQDRMHQKSVGRRSGWGERGTYPPAPQIAFPTL